ncbi:hypothetical protein D3C78_1410950 [compost metagenome]
MNGLSLLLQLHEFILHNQRLQLLNRIPVLQPLQHLHLILHTGVTQSQLHHKSVQLRFRQWEGPFIINWILSSQQQEGLWKLIADPVNGDPFFFHCFEQSGLRLRRGSIAFIRQYDR